ncbi:MAG: prolyl oligopeptidase family serine peptidase [Xanthomonadales bacterium]|nr:prolyl oligopeptidase family serine peptidase [Xanthomonadales bacterium]
MTRALVLLLLLGQPASPQAADLPSWLIDPPRRNVSLDDDAERMAWSRGPIVEVASLESTADPARHELPGHVEALRWVDDRLLVHSSSVGEERLDLVHPESGKTRALAAVTAEDRLRLRIVDVRDRRILFASDQRRRYEPDLYAAELPDLHVEMVERNPGWVWSWRTDQRGEVRMAQRWRPSGSGIRYDWLLRRGGLWQTVGGFDLGDDEEQVLRITDRGLLLAQFVDSRSVLRWFDPLSRQYGEPVWEGESRILGVVDALDGPPGLIALEAERPKTLSLSGLWPDRLARLEKDFPGYTPVLVDRAPGDRTLLWKLYSDRDPGRYVLQADTGEASAVLHEADAIDPARSRPVQTFSFTSRDGLELSGYVTGATEGKARPGVILVHGGPWARDSWGFHPEAQYLAGQGYAVIQVNFRGSRGLGSDLLRAGRREWGRAMQTDLVDAADAAVEAGWVDPDRICIMGASYGGYAALMGVLQHPETFRCAISRAPVTDLPGYVEAIRSSNNRRGYLEWREMVGADARLRAVSPYTLAAGLERPVLIAHGKHDRVVPLAHSRRFAEATDLADLLVLDARHRMLDGESRRTFYAAVTEFLSGQLDRAE